MRGLAFLLVGAGLSALGTGAVAQTAPAPSAAVTNSSANTNPSAADVGDIIVTARKVAEPLSKAPVAVTAFTQEQLRQREIRQPQDLNIATPSLTVTTGASSDGRGGRDQANYQVRGLSVGGAIYFAGAPGGAGAQQFYDLASVQIVNGPQGTLFGRTSTGGAVLYEPNRPTFNFDGSAQVGLGNYNFKRFDGMINVPVIKDVLAVRLAGFVLRRDGYTRSLDTGQRLDNQHRESFRLGIEFNPFGDTLKSYTMLQYNNINENGAGDVVRDFNPNFLLGGALPVYQQGFFDNLIPGLPFPLTFGQATFGSICAAEASRSGVPGNAAFIAGCAKQRGDILSTIGQQYATAAARTQAGHIRETNTSEDNAFYDKRWTILNNSVLDLGGEGFFSKASIKNIFSYSWPGSVPGSFNDLDGIAGVGLNLQAAQPTLVLGTCQTTGANIGYCTPPTQGRSTAFPTNSQLSEEVNVSATLAGHLDLLLGYFAYREKQGYNYGLDYSVYGNVFDLGLAPVLPSASEMRKNLEHGAFISGTLDLSDWLLHGLKVGAGFRHTTTSTDVLSEATPGTGVFSPINSHDKGNSRSFTIDWQASNNVLIYARSGSGFQPGGVNGCSGFVSDNGTVCPATYKKQSVTDYEVGTKLQWRLGDLKARTEAAIYQTNFTNIQKAQFVTDTQTNVVFNPTLNTAKARIRGFEISQSLSYNAFTLSANYSLTDSKYLKDFQPQQPAKPCTDPYNNSANDCLDLSGDPLLGVAKHKFGILASWTLPVPGDRGKITPSLQASYISRVHYGEEPLNPNSSAPGYWLVNARIDYNNVMGYPIDIAVFGRNILNKGYVTAVLPLEASSLFGFNTVQYGEPAMYGVELRYRFGASAR